MFLMHRNLLRCGKQLRTLVTSSVKSAKDEGSSSDNNAKGETIERLNKLLKIMVEEDSSKLKTPSQSLELSKPKPKIGKNKSATKQKGQNLGDKIQEAVKNVAETIPGNSKQVEADLLEKLLGKPSSSSLSDIISGMKVEQNQDKEKTRAQQVRSSLQKPSRKAEDFVDESFSFQLKSESRKLRTKKSGIQIDVFGAEPSKYFADLKPATDVPKLETWDNCLNRELRLAVTHPPSNIYQQMIIWTDRGIFWKFPIDNEQGLEDEKNVSFEDHIFLETHLEGWCPEKGPIKQFMELVCVGLSKNFWMTAEEKKQHILWFRDYFLGKNALLKEIGAGTIVVDKPQEKTVQT